MPQNLSGQPSTLTKSVRPRFYTFDHSCLIKNHFLSTMWLDLLSVRSLRLSDTLIFIYLYARSVQNHLSMIKLCLFWKGLIIMNAFEHFIAVKGGNGTTLCFMLSVASSWDNAKRTLAGLCVGIHGEQPIFAFPPLWRLKDAAVICLDFTRLKV